MNKVLDTIKTIEQILADDKYSETTIKIEGLTLDLNVSVGQTDILHIILDGLKKLGHPYEQQSGSLSEVLVHTGNTDDSEQGCIYLGDIKGDE